MGKSQRVKGRRGEQQTATEIRTAFPHLAEQIKRGWQSREGSDDPDICGFDLEWVRFWVEVKTGKKPNVRSAMEQAREASNMGQKGVPLAVIRDDRKAPLAVLEWDKFLEILKKVIAAEK